MENAGTFEAHLRSIQKAFARGQIRSEREINFDQYFSHLKDNRLSTGGSVLARKTGPCTAAVLDGLLAYKHRLEALFLGPGTGYECFDAENMISGFERKCSIDTVSLTPFAPDISPHHTLQEQTRIPPFVRHQWIGEFPHISNVPNERYHIVSDQLGALFYASARTPEKAIRAAYGYANPQFGFIINEVVHAHPDSVVFGDEAEQENPREKQFEEWQKIKAPDDVFLHSDKAAILIRGAQPLMDDVLVFPSTFQMCLAVKKICEKLFAN